MNKFKVALIQEKLSKNIEDNIMKYINLIENAKEKGADLVVLPELYRSHYFCISENPEYFDLAETLPGESTKLFSSLAKKLKIVIITTIFEKRSTGIYHNTLIVIDNDGELAGIYRKMHIPDDPLFFEKFYFTPGDTGFKPIKTKLCRIGGLICWDQWFPEAARIMALNNADILIYPSAIGWFNEDNENEKKRQLEAWITIQRSHAIANGIYVISVNRVGFEKNPDKNLNISGILFWGNSFVCDPFGEIIAKSNNYDSELLLSEIDLSYNEKVRRIWPFFRDRRVDFYSDLKKIFYK